MTLDTYPVFDEQSPSNSLQLLLSSNTFATKSLKLNLTFQVHVLNETKVSNQKCFIMTVHDLASNHMQFEKFINSPAMTGIRNRAVWLNVNLPGQEPDAQNLGITKYPGLEDIGGELVCVLDYLKIPQVVCMGNGVGANISTYFALKNPSRCLGLVIMEPISSSASLFESIRNRFNNIKKDNQNENENLNQSDQCLFKESRNPANVALFAEAFFNRSCLLNDLRDLRMDALIAVGKMSPLYSETKKFYRTLQELNRKTPQRLVNSPYLEIENCQNILLECPERLATSLQYFLQGIGLVSAMPMQKVNQKKMSITSSIISDSPSEDFSSSSSVTSTH